jgi:hypothetical protein
VALRAFQGHGVVGELGWRCALFRGLRGGGGVGVALRAFQGHGVEEELERCALFRGSQSITEVTQRTTEVLVA